MPNQFFPGPWVEIRINSTRYRARYEEQPPEYPYHAHRKRIILHLQRYSTFWWRLIGASPWWTVDCEPLGYIPAVSVPSTERVRQLARAFEKTPKHLLP